MKLDDENTLKTYDGVQFDCPRCNRRIHLAHAIEGRECQCGLPILGVEILTGDVDE